MSDTEEERVFEIEIAKNGRAGCKKCKQKCLQGVLRIAKVVPNPFADGKMKNWHHVDCLFEMFKKQRATTKRIEHEDDIIGFDILSNEDQELVRDKIKESQQFFGITKSPQKKTPKKAKDVQSQKILKAEGASPNKTQDPNTPDNLFKTFQNIVDKIAKHPSYLEKTAIVKNFFEKGSGGTGFNGDIEIWCRLLLPGSVKRIYNLQSKQLVKLFSRILLEDQDEMLEHLEQGDISETISYFYQKSRKYNPTPTESTLTVQKVDTFLEYLSKLTREEDQISHFTNILKHLTANDLKTIIRLIKHDLRMGAGAKHILEGIHPDAYSVYQASKDIDRVVERCFGNRKVQNAEINVLTPVFPMLAEACKSVEYAMKKCPNGMFSEIKYDGERVQVHKHGNEFKYFSRSLKPVMPHKVAHFKDYIPKAFPHAKDLILDAEILMMDTTTGKPLPFGTLGVHKKAQFKDATVCLFVFDCIYYNGESLMKKPLEERKRILNENMKEVPNHIVFSEMQEIDEPGKLAQMIAKVLKLGLEGLVLKDKMSKYEPGKRHWLKVKKDYLFDGAMADSADLIVLGAWYGTGQKGGMMSVFLMGCYEPRSKKFCTVTKVHTGHDDKTLEQLQEELQMVKISGDADRVPSWLKCTRSMIPDFVAEDPKKQPIWEITGAEFTQQHDVHTADGISIRFPRVTKIRNDKTWETATNVEELRTLFKNSKENTDVSLLLKDYKGQMDNSASSSSLSPKKRKNENGTSVSSRDISFSEKPKKRKKDSIETSDSSIIEESKNSKKNSKELDRKVNRISNGESKTSSRDNSLSKYNSSQSPPKKRKVNIENALPAYFENVKALFVTSDYPEIERYFLAYKGLILDKKKCYDATHIIHFNEKIKERNMKWPKNVKHLHATWIVDSVNKGRLQSDEKYIVKWEPIVDKDDESRYNNIFKK
ncbi:DNA ligase 3 [Anthonomus grandis grandis]|uniref:DNA ligase 3 n=1 Tax=Anthonomus grandis grandis TaxID=2921223 RepID=UPI002165F353|nr:DNA ligase 3 [Anthonomus grandis grandis]